MALAIDAFKYLPQDVHLRQGKTHITGHENGPKQDSEHETIILEMYVVHNQKSRVKKQGG